jgi:hypothetical protein
MEVIIWLLLILAGTDFFWSFVGAVFTFIFQGFGFIFKMIAWIAKAFYYFCLRMFLLLIYWFRQVIIPYSGILLLLLIPVIHVFTWFVSQDYVWLPPIILVTALLILSMQKFVTKRTKFF